LKLLEHQAKRLFHAYSIPIPSSYLIDDPESIERFKGDIVLKAQVPTGGRGKAGGIQFASKQKEARDKARGILGMEIGGYKVRNLLVEELISPLNENYLSIVVDRQEGVPVMIASPEGGVEIESVSEKGLRSWPVDPFLGVDEGMIDEVAGFLKIPPDAREEFSELMNNAWRLFNERDLELLEINPLALTRRGLMAFDAKIVVNQDSLFRHPEFSVSREEMDPIELQAREKGISFVQLEGSIGVIANGAGLTMATLDVLSLHGGQGGAFLDLGGADDPQKVVEAFQIIGMVFPSVILVNIFGGITKCDTVAEGIIRARRELDIEVPIVVRIRGVREVAAWSMLEKEGIHSINDLDEACRKAIDLEAI
jgi:succinyl-CoA synthetase beta subunit